MTPKKIACFVEGQTEQIFVERLFQEIAGYKQISIETYKFQGGKDNRIIQSLKPSIVKDAPFFFFYIIAIVILRYFLISENSMKV